MTERTPELDHAIAVHEASHAFVGLCISGSGTIGYATIEPGAGYAGRVVGTGGDAVNLGTSAQICAEAQAFWPGLFEPRDDCAPFVLHSINRATELAAGTAGEEVLIGGPPLQALADRKQLLMFAKLVCASPHSVEAFLEWAAAEARNLIAANRSVVLELAAALVERRTMTGDEITELVMASLVRQDFEAEKKRRADWARCLEGARAFAAYRSPAAARKSPLGDPT
jgi:hypothetical protein